MRRAPSKPILKVRLISTTLILFTLLHWSLFIALGILATQVNLGNTVRSLSTHDCGVWRASAPGNPNSVLNLNMVTATELYINTTLAAENYVRNCYTAASATIPACNVYIRPSFPHTTQVIPCPLRNSALCSAPGSTALAVESSNMSLSDLAINWPHAKDIYIRRRSVFAPIFSEPFLYSKEASQDYVDKYISGDPPIAEPERIQVLSYVIDKSGMNFTSFHRRNINGGEYDVLVQFATNGTLAMDLLKPRELAPKFTIVAFRGSSVSFPARSDDPLFYAQVNYTTFMANNNITMYKMGRPLNAIVCQDMVEVCGDLTNYCTGWIGPTDLATDINYTANLLGPLVNANTSWHAIGIVSMPLMQATTYFALLNRGASGLQATRKLFGGMQYMISSEQWKVEAENWFRISLAWLQMAPHRMVVTPDLDRSRVNRVDIFSTPWACYAIKFRSSKHATLSFFGIMTIIAICAALTLVSYLDEFLGRVALKTTSFSCSIGPETGTCNWQRIA